jgi:hypothetical protein
MTVFVSHRFDAPTWGFQMSSSGSGSGSSPRRARSLAAVVAAGAVLAATVVASTSTAVTAAPSAASTASAPSASPVQGVNVKVGAASRSVLPTVDGRRDYLAEIPAPTDPFSPGVFVPKWDQGTVAIGNGWAESHWVRDDLRASAMAVEGSSSGPIAVLVSVDLYMLIEPDIDLIRAKVADQLPAALADRVEVLVAVTHTHHGPETVELSPSRQVNFEWFDLMTTEVADAVVEAVTTRGPARLRSASGNHWFGAANYRDPRVIDPTMNVLQAVRPSGEVVATAVQWNSHPEMTLNWKPEVDGGLDLSAQCLAAVPPLTTCTAEGRYHTADYPGHLRRVIQEQAGGEVVYFIGALGSMVSPSRTIWEVDELQGLGDHFTPPPGAAFPGTGAQTARDFRRAAIIGEQAGYAALAILAERGRPITDRTIEVRHQAFHTRLSNMGFRLLLRTDAQGRPFIGASPTPLYLCPDAPANYDTCVDDGLATVNDPIIGLPVRVGNHVRPSVSHLRLGPIGMLFTPGEVQSHLVLGLPADFRSGDGSAYYSPSTAAFHVPADQLSIPGPLLDLVEQPQKWFIGIGQGALGYVIPIDDWRVYCIGDALAGAGTCAGLHAAGLIAYPDSLSGIQCKTITENPASLAGLPANVQQVLAGSCTYGQAFGEAKEHYEETNAVGWDIAADLHAAVERMLGTSSNRQINPDFIGYWQGKRGTPPNAPATVTATAGNKSVAVSWSAVPGAASYQVRVLPDGPTVYVDAPATSVAVGGLANGRAVTVAVSARVDNWLRSASTASATVTPTPGPPAR